MKSYEGVVLCLLAALVAMPADAGTLYFSQDDNPNGLYRINVLTGAATLVGSGQTAVVGFTVGLAASPVDGILSGSTPFFFVRIQADGQGATVLPGSAGAEGLAYDTVRRILYASNNTNFFTLDPSTGLQTASLASPGVDLEALDVDPATGLVYGLAAGSTSLFVYTPGSNSWGTVPGDTGVLWRGASEMTGPALAFDPEARVLYAMSGGAAPGPNLYRIDPATAATTLVGPTGIASGGGLAFVVDARIVTGAGAGGGPHVLVRTDTDHDGQTDTVLASFFAYAGGFTGGVRVASCDVNADGVPDIVTGPGPGGGPHVKVFDGLTGAEVLGFFAYGPTFTGGVFVACGDLDGDGKADIITGADAGGGPHVRVFSGATGLPILEFFAYAATFTGGVRVASCDVNGDGVPDIITAAGPGGGPHVRVFSGITGAELLSLFAYAPGFTGGVFVACGDTNGDGKADIITGADAGGGPHVRVFSGATGADLGGFFAYSPGFLGGVRVAARDLTGDGRADIITGAGPGGGPHVGIWNGVTFTPIDSFFAYPPTFTGGVFVGAR